MYDNADRLVDILISLFAFAGFYLIVWAGNYQSKHNKEEAAKRTSARALRRCGLK